MSSPASAAVAPVQSPPARPTLDNETYDLVQQLFQLVRSGQARRVERLLELGLVPNLRDGKGDSLLMLACYHGHVELAAVLLRHGADPEIANDRGQTPLAAAAFKGDLVGAQLLLDHGAHVDARLAGGKTALMYAAMFDRTAMIDLLLHHGADPYLADDEGATALVAARTMGAMNAAARLADF